MSRITNRAAAVREYRSELREQQTEETRGRILDAALRVMADGFASVSIPAVAREAGVSVPTVYRHFATKQELLAALYPHIVRRAGLNELTPPQTLDGIRDGIRSYAAHLDAFDDLARAAIASPSSEEARHLSMTRRFAMFRPIAESVEPKLSEADRDRITRLMIVLTASGSLRMWRDHLGFSVEAMAEDIEWFMRAAVAAAQSPSPQ